MNRVYFEGTQACAISPEGKQASMPLPALLSKLTGPLRERQEVILPPGVVASITRGRHTIWIFESQPEIFNFQWIANNSKAKYGPNASYREVRIALPYVVILAVFGPSPTGQVVLCGDYNECFFRVEPLQSYHTADLYFPALLNCSARKLAEKKPLSWICTQYLNHSYTNESDINARMQGAFLALHQVLFDAAYNLSSDVFEGSSWYTESQGVDKRISPIENWEKATVEDKSFVLKVPWKKVGYTLGQVVERTFANLNAPTTDSVTADTLARIIFNQ